MSVGRQVPLAILLGVLFTAAICAVIFGVPRMTRVAEERVITPIITPSEPAISVTAGGLTIDGIEGSYCTMQVCVDKVGPTGFADVTFIPIDSTVITVTLRDPAHEVAIGLRDENGATLLCDMQTVKQDDMRYTATICGDAGRNYYVDVGAWWAEGGDATFYFPIATP